MHFLLSLFKNFDLHHFCTSEIFMIELCIALHIREGSKKNPEKQRSFAKLGGGGSPRVHQKPNPKCNDVFLSDPGVPGVRSMGPDVCH